MEENVEIQPAAQSQTQSAPAESTVRKGRRGLARKTLPLDAPSASSSTISHNASVYSSCVSRGLHKNMLVGAIESTDCQSQGRPLGQGGDNVIIINDVEAGTGTVPVKDTKDKEDLGTTPKPKKDHNDLLLGAEDDEDLIEIGECSGGDVASVLATLRSPTPPPDSHSPGQIKKHRMNKKLKSALSTLNRAKGNLNRDPSTPFSRSRRRGKAATPRTSDIVLMDAVESPATKSDILIKVRYLSSIHRIPFNITNPFYALMAPLSRETGEEERHLSLFLRDEVLPLSKTPREVGLTVADIIECHCMKEVKGGDVGNESIGLLIQCRNSKRKTPITVTQRQPFHEILSMYAQEAGVDASSVHFCFDGDDVGPSDTPLSLDMEEGDILDLVPASTAQARAAYAMSNQVITLL